MKYQKYLTVLQMAIGVTPSNRGSLLPLKRKLCPSRAGRGPGRPGRGPERERERERGPGGEVAAAGPDGARGARGAAAMAEPAAERRLVLRAGGRVPPRPSLCLRRGAAGTPAPARGPRQGE
ncbi:hypothetical protein P7K49_012802 [Saguinus oedipus]|uniref:Uncharacterized protein n=1 Tax=Saguinus oedipus TaxID=9490 RepID=A0ABQ9VEI0_SAGOE|nr:hypothetical protein P7K49_012802 [Saguinus oedipus]